MNGHPTAPVTDQPRWKLFREGLCEEFKLYLRGDAALGFGRHCSRLSCYGLTRTASEGAVRAGGGGFGGGAGFASLGAEAGGHPFARAEEAFEERGEVEVGVELGEVDAVAGG